MGEAGPVGGLSDAAGRPAVDRLAARSALSRFWRDERGATAVELGFMVAMIALALVGILGALQGNISISFGKIASAMDKANSENP
jgi:pilus assembly protein Flp/PilA